MPTTLVSFVGKGWFENPKDKHSHYARAEYRFPAWGGRPANTRKTTLFAAALLDHLKNDREVDVQQWLVLGTSASQWSEVLLGLPEDQSARMEEAWRAVADIESKARDGCLSQPDLDRWEEDLNGPDAPVTFCLALVGEMFDRASQDRLCHAMLEHIPAGNSVVFDVTHGFRSQPLIATFLVGFMRHTHRLHDIQFCYGTHNQKTNQGELVELPICQEILQATESLAIANISGNYAPLARTLKHDAARWWFLQDTNQLNHAKRPLAKLLEDLESCTEALGPVAQRSLGVLRDHLRWVHGSSLPTAYEGGAQRALNVDDYLHAVILTYEGILTRAILAWHRSAKAMSYPVREECGKRIPKALRGPDRQLFREIRTLRNSCVHGVPPQFSAVQRALANPEDFRALIRRGLDLYERLPSLLDGKPGPTAAVRPETGTKQNARHETRQRHRKPSKGTRR